jgi:hypothetical protein
LIDTWYVHTGVQIESEKWILLLCKWFLAFLVDRGEELYKFQSCYLFCKLSGQTEFPEVPKDFPADEKLGFLLPSNYYRFLRKGIGSKRFDPSYVSLGYALMDVKRAGLPLSEMRQAMFFEKHRSNMCGAEYKGKGDPQLVQEIKESISEIVNWIGDAGEPKDRVPTLSAVCNVSRSAGGFLGRIHQDNPYLKLEAATRSYLISMSEIPGRSGHREFHVPFLREEINAIIEQGVDFELQKYPKLPAFVCKVLEPFKVRPITLSYGYCYHWVRRFQRSYHDRMRCLKPFQLIGKGWDSSLSTLHIAGSTQKFWNSGDFTAATDGIHPEIQEYCTWQVLLNNPCLFDTGGNRITKFGECLRRSMDMHDLVYPDGKSVVQEWGQLMGSPFSFLVLCIINLACTYAAYRSISKCSLFQFLEEARPLINGDDNLFGFPSMDYYNRWVEYSAEAGLNRSMGKNYVSDKFLIINSRMMLIHRGDNGEVRYLTECFTCNSGLLRGQSRVLSDDRRPKSDLEVDQLLVAASDQINELSSQANSLERSRIASRFMYNMRKDLKRSHRSWSLHRSLGGLGLPTRSEPNFSQRKLAGALLLSDSPIDRYEIVTGKEEFEHTKFARKKVEEYFQSSGRLLEPVVWTTNQPTPAYELRDNLPDYTLEFIGRASVETVKTTSRFTLALKKVLGMPFISPLSMRKRWIEIRMIPSGRISAEYPRMGDEDLNEAMAFTFLEINSFSW